MAREHGQEDAQGGELDRADVAGDSVPAAVATAAVYGRAARSQTRVQVVHEAQAGGGDAGPLTML